MSKRGICSRCGSIFKWSPKFYKDHGLDLPPLTCPTCVDERSGKPDHQIVEDREALHVFQAVDVSQVLGALDFEKVEEQDGKPLPIPYYRAVVKGKRHGASWSGRIDIFDQRTDHTEFVAQVRIMRTTHRAGETQTGVSVTGPHYPWHSRSTYEWGHSDTWEYVVVEDPEAAVAPTHKLVFVSAIQKWNRDDYLNIGNAIWKKVVRGSSRSGKHSGQSALCVAPIDAPIASVRVHDKGALHKGDFRTLREGGPEAHLLLQRKAAKGVEVTEKEV